jgi:hypothetical protein
MNKLTLSLLLLLLGVGTGAVALVKYGLSHYENETHWSPEVVELQIYHFRPNKYQLTSEPAAYTKDTVKIRLLVLKHSREQMADDDANLAVHAATNAASRGLAIQVIGNEYATTLNQMESWVKKKVQEKAESGDTLIIHTIGHGHPDGSLAGIGQRANLMKVFAEVAEAYQQEIMWWQLSCHAAAGLPSIKDLTDEQQNHFTNLASSTANQISPAVEQGRIMEKLFMALADGGNNVDPNGDGTITAGELRDFLNKLDGRRRGDLLFAKNAEQPIFGHVMLIRLIPIIDRNGSQQTYPKDYIPLPRKDSVSLF